MAKQDHNSSESLYSINTFTLGICVRQCSSTKQRKGGQLELGITNSIKYRTTNEGQWRKQQAITWTLESLWYNYRPKMRFGECAAQEKDEAGKTHTHILAKRAMRSLELYVQRTNANIKKPPFFIFNFSSKVLQVNH